MERRQFGSKPPSRRQIRSTRRLLHYCRRLST